MKKSIKQEKWKWVFIHYAQLLCYLAKEDEEKVQKAKAAILRDSYLSQALLPLLKHYMLIEEKPPKE